MQVEPGKWTELIGSELSRIQDILTPAAPRPSRLQAGERRIAAILFLDLCNFTGLAYSLDHEVLKDLLDAK